MLRLGAARRNLLWERRCPLNDDTLREFAEAVRDMMAAQEAARVPGAIVHERHLARDHERNVRQWIRSITAEELAVESEGRAAA